MVISMMHGVQYGDKIYYVPNRKLCGPYGRLNEAKGAKNVAWSDFLSQMEALGFTYDDDKKSPHVVFKYVGGDVDGFSVTVARPHNNGAVSGDAFDNVKNKFIQVGWFTNPDNYDKFPWVAWYNGVRDNRVKPDYTQRNIKDANEKYKDASVNPVFQEKNSVCVLKTEDGCNLCRSKEDRRPLLPDWYEKFGYDITGKIPCLKRDNDIEIQTEAFPILPNGELDTDNMIIESVKYGKSVTRMRKR